MVLDAVFTSVRLLIALILPPILGWLLLRVLARGELVLSRLEQTVAAWALGWGIITLTMFVVGIAAPPGMWHPLPLLALWLCVAILLVLLDRWQAMLSPLGWHITRNGAFTWASIRAALPPITTT